MSSELVSVVIPARNAAPTIGPTIESLSDVADLIGEIILIDDGSTDDTAAQARAAATRIGVPLALFAGPARGVSAARNLGLDAAACPLIYLMDADDKAISPGFRRLVEALDSDPTADLIVGACLDNDGGRESRHEPGHFSGSPLRNAEDYISYQRPLIRPGSALGRRALLIGQRFPEGVPYQEDGIYWTKVLTTAVARSLSEPVIRYYLDEARSAMRLVTDHRAKYLAMARAIRALSACGLSRRSLRVSRGANALTVARKLTRAGLYRSADRFLKIAWRADAGWRYRYWVCKARVKLALFRVARPR